MVVGLFEVSPIFNITSFLCCNIDILKYCNIENKISICQAIKISIIQFIKEAFNRYNFQRSNENISQRTRISVKSVYELLSAFTFLCPLLASYFYFKLKN